MKKFFVCLCMGAFVLSCNNSKDKTAATSADSSAATNSSKPSVDLPYTASYSSSWSQDVSDADLKTVLMSYKNWTDGNFSELAKEMGDTVTVEMNSGDHMVKTNADLMKYWSNFRDSLSSVRIDMEGWNKMYATDKKEGYIVTWYKEYDTYKTGKVDSAAYHDINQLKDGKITWYSQYKRPLK
jgi:ketosteroid isomerase-like protein